MVFYQNHLRERGGWGVEGGGRAGNRGKVQAYDKSFTYVTDNNNRYHLQSTNHFAKQKLDALNELCVCDRYAGWLLSVSAGTAARDDGPHEQRHDVARVQPALIHPTPGGAHDAGHSHPARWLHAPAAHSSGPAIPCFSKVSTTCHSSSLIHPGECYTPQQFPAPHVPSTVTGSQGGGVDAIKSVTVIISLGKGIEQKVGWTQVGGQSGLSWCKTVRVGEVYQSRGEVLCCTTHRLLMT